MVSATYTPAYNRLVYVKETKAVADNNLSIFPVCNIFGCKLCDRESMGLEMELVVRCAVCDKV